MRLQKDASPILITVPYLFSNHPNLLEGEASQCAKILKNSNIRPQYTKKDDFLWGLL